ncbi:hypothetical protein ACP26L_09215 [Paenibacillus sp. S-38]|uniref:hypothetical protein n=1 Tax=Paenibacillus sp. S-38 TaxID=3416710 RepID=UPI003CE87E90
MWRIAQMLCLDRRLLLLCSAPYEPGILAAIPVDGDTLFYWAGIMQASMCPFGPCSGALH